MCPAAVSSEQQPRPPSGIPGPREGTSVDPICRMEVDESAPKGGSADHGGRRYYFCNPRCREKFQARPEAALAAYAEAETGAAEDRGESRGQAGARELLDLTGMSCAACAAAIERGLRKVPGVARAAVNFAASKAYVEFDPGRASRAELVSAVLQAGYGVREAGGSRTVELTVEGMGSPHCAGLVEKALRGLDGVETVAVNLGAGGARSPTIRPRSGSPG